MNDYSVYRHTNKLNNKVYIGITRQKVENRWKNGNGYGSQHFSRAIHKYGWNNFTHEVIAEGLSKEDACEMERILIKAHNSTCPKFGYNQTNGGEGGGMLKHHHSKDTKKKISDARKINGFSDEHRKHISDAKAGINHHFAKKVYQYTTDGRFIREWDYMSLASKELNINKGNIGEVCNGHRKTAGGFVWQYERT